MRRVDDVHDAHETRDAEHARRSRRAFFFSCQRCTHDENALRC